jgi:hypothetical protein
MLDVHQMVATGVVRTLLLPEPLDCACLTGVPHARKGAT